MAKYQIANKGSIRQDISQNGIDSMLYIIFDEILRLYSDISVISGPLPPIFAIVDDEK